VVGRRYVLAAALLWSVGGVITKSLALDSLTIAFYRSLFAGLVLLPMVPWSRWVFRPALIPLCVIFGAMIALYIGAVMSTTAANAIYLQFTCLFWTVPLSAWFLGEPPDRRSLVGIALAIVGIGVIVCFGYDGRPNEWQGIALGLASGLGYAAVSVMMRALRTLDPIWLSAVGNLGGSLMVGACLLASRGAIVLPSRYEVLVLFAFGAFQMAIPYALYARGLRDIGAPEAGLIALLEPILNPIWVFVFIHERPTVPTLIGGLFLLSGVVFRYWQFRFKILTNSFSNAPNDC
jgi:drug/metabolite transporter (DMT)-like permease